MFSSMSDPNNICRLCKSPKYLTSLFDMDGEVNLNLKTVACVDLKIHPDDGLPSKICKHCKKKVQKFYNFKQHCLEVDFELRIEKYSVTLEEQNSTDSIPILEYFSESDFKESSEGNVEIINYENRDNIQLTGKTNEDLQTFTQCEICGSLFNTKIELRKHMTSHGGTKLYQCKFCPKRFTRSESNIVHMKCSHLGIRSFICEICGQPSRRRQDLLRHMKIHSDERKHECHHCGRSFKRSSDLRSHIRTHSGLRPYKCKLCEKSYTSHSGLRKHYQMHCKKDAELN